MTQPLSPDAQAIWDALDMGELSGPQQLLALAHATAALQAAADQVVPASRQGLDQVEAMTTHGPWASVYLHGMSDAASNIANKLFAIAAELEGVNG